MGGAALREDALRQRLAARVYCHVWRQTDDDPSDLLALRAMGTLLRDADQAYDQVLVCCRPADTSADGLALAAHDVRVLLVAVGRDLVGGQVDATLRRFFRAGVAVMGVVVLPRPMRSTGGSGRGSRAARREPTLR